jgi:hypothetical protein
MPTDEMPFKAADEPTHITPIYATFLTTSSETYGQAVDAAVVSTIFATVISALIAAKQSAE